MLFWYLYSYFFRHFCLPSDNRMGMINVTIIDTVPMPIKVGTQQGDSTQHHVDMSATWWWVVSPFYDFCRFWCMAVNTADKLQFLSFIYTYIYRNAVQCPGSSHLETWNVTTALTSCMATTMTTNVCCLEPSFSRDFCKLLQFACLLETACKQDKITL